MGADSSVAITAGTGTSIDTFQKADGQHQQIVREARATAIAAPVSWTVTTAGQASVVAADDNRIALMLVSQANGRVFVRLDSTIPSATSHHYFLSPGDRWEVPEALSTLAVSLDGESAGGIVLITTATAS